MPATRPKRHTAAAPSPLRNVAGACLAAFAIVAALAIVVLPGGQDAAPTATAPTVVERAAATIAPTQAPNRPPTATNAGRAINLDLGPLLTAPASTARPTARPPRAPTRTPGPPAPNDVELVANGKFETADGSWYLEQSAEFASGDTHAGIGALALGPGPGYADQRVPVRAGATYRVTVWTKLTASGDSGQIGVRYEDGAFAAITALTPIVQAVAGTDWARTTFTFTAPPGAARAVLSFWHPSGAGFFLVDDVSVREFVPS